MSAAQDQGALSVVLETLFASFGTERVFMSRCCGNLYVGIVAPGICKRCQQQVQVTTVDLASETEKQHAIDNLK